MLRSALEAIINKGNSVFFKGKQHTKVSDLPSQAEIDAELAAREAERISLAKVPASRTITINGETKSLAQNISFEIDGTTDSLSASDIAQDSTHRFVSDSEKANWNAKTSVTVSTTAPSNPVVNQLWVDIS